jgi:uncharacterized membrane protein YbhN (UPF0104 family)
MDIKVKKRLVWAILFSIGFTVFLVSRVDWSHFSIIADRLDMSYLIAAFGVFLFGNLIRTFRFYRLDHLDKKLTHWWNIGVLYNLATTTLPGGSGEAAMAYVLKRYSKFNILSALRILLLSRLMDLFALSALFLIAAIMLSSDTYYREAAIWLSGILFFISSVTLLRSSEQFVMRLLQKLPGNSAFIKKMFEKLSELIIITREQRKKKSFGVTLFQSVIMWGSGFIILHLLLRSFGIDFTLIQSGYCYGVYAVFQSMPVQGIAGIGTQAAWWTLALNATGYDAPDAIALGFILYGIYYGFIAVMGLCSMIFWLKGRQK